MGVSSSSFLAGYNSTVYISVTYNTKERPIGAIGAVRARGVHHMRTQCVGLRLGGTQWMSLSAANVRNRCSKLHVVHINASF